MPFQDVGQIGGRLHREALGLGVELFFRRSKHDITTRSLELFAVGRECARVGVEVFVRAELQAVDEDAGHGHIAHAAGVLDQGQMARMQIAHGGHKSGVAVRSQGAAQLGDGVNNLHAAHQACWASSGNWPLLTACT